MFNTPKKTIGILMATYNGEKYIDEQINSILEQTYKNWKLLIHDDNSTDGTVEKIRKFEEKYPDKVVFIDDGVKCGGSKENFSHLINVALNNFNFDYVMFCDQDDVWLSHKIEVTLRKMLYLENKFGSTIPILVHTDLKVVDENLGLISNSLWKYQKLNPNKNKLNYLLVQNNITGCTMMINKSLLYKSKIIPKEAIMHDWWIGLTASTFGVISHLKEPTILYRQHLYNDTGAKKIHMSYLISRLKDTNSIIKSIDRTLSQAEAFRKIFHKDLNTQQKSFLDNYISLKNNGFFKNLHTVFKFNFFKQDILRTLGFITAVTLVNSIKHMTK